MSTLEQRLDRQFWILMAIFAAIIISSAGIVFMLGWAASACQ